MYHNYIPKLTRIVQLVASDDSLIRMSRCKLSLPRRLFQFPTERISLG